MLAMRSREIQTIASVATSETSGRTMFKLARIPVLSDDR